MQRIFKISLILNLLLFISCTDYEIKKYKIKSPSAAQQEEIDEILSEKGIGGVEIDSVSGFIIIEYVPKLNTLRRIEEFLDENDLLLEELPKINPKFLQDNESELELDTLIDEMTEELQVVEDSINEQAITPDTTKTKVDTNRTISSDTIKK